MSTRVHKNYVKPSSHRVADDVSGQDDAELMKAVITGEDDDGHFHNVKTTHDGSLSVADESSGLSIAQGHVSGASYVHKFGAAPDFDTGDGFVTVWDGADDGNTGSAMSYTYSSTAAIDSVSSDNGGDTFNMEIQGLTLDYTLIVQTVTLNGQTRVAMPTPLLRVFRMKNVGASDNVGHVYCYENTALTLGKPNDQTKIRAIIQPGNNQTLMAIYTVPAGYTAYMRSFYASTVGAKLSGVIHTLELRARPLGQVFQLKHTSNFNESGTSHVTHNYIEPQAFSEKTDIEMRASTDTDIAGVAAGFDIVLIENG